MGIKIKLTERQRKLAADELTDDDVADDADSLRESGFDFDDSEGGQGKGSDGEDSNAASASGNDSDDDGIEPSGEYIDEDDSDAGDDSASGGDTDGDDGSWLDDRAREFAASYGLAEDELGQFGSFEELQRFGTIMDRRYASATGGQQPGERQSGDDEQQGGDTRTGGAESGSQAEQKPKLLDRLKPLDRKKYEEANYGENELEMVDQLNGVLEAIREFAPAIDAYRQQQERQIEEQKSKAVEEFHKTLDEVDPAIYGKAYDGEKLAGKLSDAFDSNRQTVLDVMERLKQGIVSDAQRRGVDPQIPSVRALTQRAAAIVSGINPNSQQSTKVDTSKVAGQSRRRRPSGTGGTRGAKTGGTRGGGKPMSEADEVKAIANNPAIAKFYRDAQRENGAI